MANNTKSGPNMGVLKRLASRVQSNSDAIYKSTYYSDPTDKHTLDALRTDIDASIKNIMSNNVNTVGEPNISKMYERILMNNGIKDSETMGEFKKLFEDNDFLTSLSTAYMDNRWIKALDDEIDEILRYFPKLEEALQTIRDNVLSADSFSKDFLNIKDTLQGEDSAVFSNNIDGMKSMYNLIKLTNETYYNTSKYGEEFIYCVPYETAIKQLLDRKQYQSVSNRPRYIKTGFNESAGFFVEDSNGARQSYEENVSSKYFNGLSYNLEIDSSGMISSVVENAKKAYEARHALRDRSLCEQYLNEHGLYVNESGLEGKKVPFDRLKDADMEIGDRKLPQHTKFDNTLGDEFEMPIDDTTADGLFTKKTTELHAKLKSMNGCIVKRLPREQVIPIYIDDVCLGYYFFEFESRDNIFERRHITTAMNNTITGLRTTGSSADIERDVRREELIKFISAQLADRIDADFVNNNQDLKKEIYHILKYNDEFNVDSDRVNNMRCTFIPPEDIQHFYFKLDEVTHRGVSDLALSLIPAKLYVSIYITNALAAMTRGNDKRVYYVKQTVETNIAKTLLKTINEIKKSNFGMRQVANINNVLDIVGRFNDYIVPRGPDGQAPIDFEVIQGQNIEIKSELLNILEEAAINVIGIPIEIIQSRQSPDYALQLTMQNSKFLRFVYGRQSDYQILLSRLFTRIYNIEYGNMNTIEVTLPPPLFINITNTNQLIVNVNDYCNTLTNEVILVDEQDDLVKSIFAKELKIYYLGSYFNLNTINNILSKARQQAKAKRLADEMAAGEEA